MSENTPFYEMPLVYDVSGMEQASSISDLDYLGTPNEGAQMDIYLPGSKPPPSGFPLLIFLHGGPLPKDGDRPLPKEWRVFQDYGRLASANGVAGVVFNHRYFGYENLPLAISDTQAAVSFLRRQAAQYELDASRIGVWAFSGAGMFIASYIGRVEPSLRCLLAFYTLFDLNGRTDAVSTIGAENLRKVTPVNLVGGNLDLPLFIARAGQDSQSLNFALDQFAQVALAANHPMELHNHPQGQHGFDFFDNDAHSRHIIARAMAFARTNLLTGLEDTHD